jgi:hypothetical protein
VRRRPTSWRSTRGRRARARSSSTRSGTIVAVDQREHRADLPPCRMGRARRPGDLGQHPRGHRGRARQGQCQPPAHRGRRHHQPARDRRRLGSRDGPADRTTRSSGRTPAPDGWSTTSAATRARTGMPTHRPAAGHLFRRAQDPLAPRQRRRGARARRGRRAALRHHGHLGAVESHRRPGRWLHVTDVTNASRTMLMDLHTLQWDSRTLCEAIGSADVDAARDPQLQRGLWRRASRACSTAPRSPASSAISRRRPSGRAA